MPFFCISCKRDIDPSLPACPYCGEPVTDFLREYLQRPIDGKYEILSRIGIGGMGEVFKVLHIHLNAVRVIKLMKPSISGDNSLTDRFVREARLATRIHQRNVATLHDFSTLPDGSWYMVWEYIEGTTITELIRRRGRLAPKYAAEIGVQALLGLDAIHRAGIIHRDVSPDNIMISRGENDEEEVKIIDLGIAKQEEDDAAEAQTKTGMFVGKWKYCSPEHLGLLKPGERIDGRADVYSFGLVMYEMLTGSAPFITNTPQQYIVMHARETPRAMSVAVPGMTASPELEALIFRALEKDRNLRFASAREFAQELQNLIPTLDVPTTASQPRPVPTAPPTPLPLPGDSTSTIRDRTGSSRPVPGPAQTIGVPAPTVAVPARTGNVTQSSRGGSSTAVPIPAAATVGVAALPTTNVRPVTSSGATTERDTPLVATSQQATAKSRRGLLIAAILVVLVVGVVLVGVAAFLVVRYMESRSGALSNAATATVMSQAPSTTTSTSTSTSAVPSGPTPGETVVVSTSPAPPPAPAPVTASAERPIAVTTSVASPPPTATLPPVRHPVPTETQPVEAPLEPQNQSGSTVAPEPVRSGIGSGIGSKFGHIIHHGQAPARFVDTDEGKQAFRHGVIHDYDKLAAGEKAQWSWIQPGFKLSDHRLAIGAFQNYAGTKDQHTLDRLTHEIGEKLGSKTSDATGGLVISDDAVFWEDSSRGIGIEMVFRDAASRKVVAMIRHTEARRSVDSATDSVVEAVSDYVDDH